MPWFKVDDTLAFHAKVVAAGNAAMGLWLRAGSWSAQTLTEGFIPDHMVSAMNGTKSAPTLVQVRLWDRVDGGYAFRGWVDYQPTRESVEAERAAARARQQKARNKAKQAREGAQSQVSHDAASQQSHGVTNGVTPALVTVPPTRPDPTPTRKRSTSSELDGDFITFWSVYPRRVGKGQAVKAWAKAVKKAEPAVIIAAAEDYAASVADKDPEFIAHPATWLNGERWADEKPETKRLQPVTYEPTPAPPPESLPWLDREGA